MRHSYTPIFKDVLTSRVWALPDAHLRVWLWLQLQADPEGFICADVTGVAVGARVSGKDAREALEVLSLADADADPSDVNQGRLLERVPKGWRVVGHEETRELAKREAQNARNRKFMRKSRAATKAANDTTEVDAVDASVDAPKPKPKSKPLTEDSETPPTPSAVDGLIGPDEYAALGFDAPSRIVSGPTIDKIPASWQPSDALRAEATIAGVRNFDDRLKNLRAGPVGGTRGIFETDIDGYVASFFGKWRTWDETDAAKAAAAASKPRGQSYRDRPEDTLTTTQAASAFRPSADHEKFCAKHELDLTHAVKLYRQSPEHDKVGFAESERRFLERLKCWAVTGTFHPDGPLPKAKRAEREGAAA